MKTQTKEVQMSDRQPPAGKLIEVKCPTISETEWIKCRLVKGGKFPLFQSMEYPGSLGAVTTWRETT